MRQLKILLLSICISFCFNSCIEEEIKLDDIQGYYDSQIGIPTEVKGNIRDDVRLINVSDYEIKIMKRFVKCKECSSYSYGIEVGSVFSDADGNYSFKFNHFLTRNEFNVIYYVQIIEGNNAAKILSENKINIGQISTINYNLIKPVILKLNIQVLNNLNPPLRASNYALNFLPYQRTYFANQTISQQNGNIVRTMYATPGFQTKIEFWYSAESDFSFHTKVFQYLPTTAPESELNYTIDCATF